MDFFKSVFSDPDPSPDGDAAPSTKPSPSSDADAGGGGGGWGFGGLIKSFAPAAESVIRTYGRDLQEFGLGLRSETAALRDAAGNLPTAAAGIGDKVAGIVSQSKAAILSVAAASSGDAEPDPPAGASKRYSRFETQLRALQLDPATFTTDPEDGEEFGEWRKGFQVEERRDEIEMICYENDAVEKLVERLVGEKVDEETFWARYFYRVYKLKQAEDARAELVKRAIARDDEEEDLSWEVDDEEEDDEEEAAAEKTTEVVNEREGHSAVSGMGETQQREVTKGVMDVCEQAQEQKQEEEGGFPAKSEPEHFRGSLQEEEVVMAAASSHTEKEGPPIHSEAESPAIAHAEVSPVDRVEETKVDTKNAVTAAEEDGKGDGAESGDYAVVSSQTPAAAEEEDIEWDEIEDLGEHIEKKASSSSSSASAPVKEELRKRLSVQEEEEDLGWDIEDEDEPAKS